MFSKKHNTRSILSAIAIFCLVCSCFLDFGRTSAYITDMSDTCINTFYGDEVPSTEPTTETTTAPVTETTTQTTVPTTETTTAPPTETTTQPSDEDSASTEPEESTEETTKRKKKNKSKVSPPTGSLGNAAAALLAATLFGTAAALPSRNGRKAGKYKTKE